MRRRFTFGAIIAALAGYLAWARDLFDWLPRLDFFVTHRKDPGWLGDAVRFLIDPPLILANPPPWSPWIVLLAGLIFLYFYDRQLRRNAINSAIITNQEQSLEYNKHNQIVHWLESVLSDNSLRITSAVLFGSVVHDHYDTSDVDAAVMFATIPDSHIGQLVRRIKEKIASDFSTTFTHPLHVTFFCSHEETEMQDFLREAGKYEILKVNKQQKVI
jgi:predicted nucleotidyltransferase